MGRGWKLVSYLLSWRKCSILAFHVRILCQCRRTLAAPLSCTFLSLAQDSTNFKSQKGPLFPSFDHSRRIRSHISPVQQLARRNGREGERGKTNDIPLSRPFHPPHLPPLPHSAFAPRFPSIPPAQPSYVGERERGGGGRTQRCDCLLRRRRRRRRRRKELRDLPNNSGRQRKGNPFPPAHAVQFIVDLRRRKCRLVATKRWEKDFFS